MNQRIQILKEKWRSVGTPIKIAAGTIGLALVIFLFFTFFMPNRFQALYTGIEGNDQAAIEKFLSSKGIEYKYETDTKTLMVDGDVIQLKKELALEGLPKGGSAGGLASFNNLSIGSTKYDKDVQYQNALQEELNQGLEGMFDVIQGADVKLPKPEDKSIFEKDNKKTSVSVGLKLKPGFSLEPEQVKAVQVYVAGAIRDVEPSDVQVVDQDLNLLSSSEGKGSNLSKQKQIQEETKKKLENELSNALSAVYGRVKVVVNVDINFDEIVRNIKKYDPQGTLLSKDEQKDRDRKVEGDNVQVPGTDQNGEVPRYEIQNDQNTKVLSAQDKDRLIENFAVGETVEKIIKHPELRNTNIAVWFDNANLTQPELIDAEEMLAVASGLTGEVQRVANDKAVYQNGSVKVTQKAFAVKDKKVTKPKETKGFFDKIPWYAYVLVGVLVLGLIITIIILVLRSKKKKEKLLEEEEILIEQQNTEIPNDVTESIDIEDREINLETNKEENMESMGGQFNIEWNKEQTDLRKLTSDVANKYPKETADVISKLLKK
ncbi:flagellar basal-body MS-ring/collar protein FliF [Bacillus sp. Brlt_9]|uniref:flagellar basal-body MS-ring/collar protein FliF n=1 Tax=Bacillus sp. Brlt_9 TaxID=3110916 RepID=UPI003F7BA268